MSLSETLIPELDHEMANARKSMALIPQNKLDWKPHAKSMSFIGLATHLANLPTWALTALEQDEFDLAPSGKEQPPREAHASLQDALEEFDKNVAAAREAIQNASDDHMLSSWSLLNGGEVLFSMPRIAVIRTWVMNHMIHHRAQLGLYLRLNDVPVPGIYGPTADDV